MLGYVDQIPNEHEGDSSDDPVESKLQELIEATFNLRKQAGATDVASHLQNNSLYSQTERLVSRNCTGQETQIG